MALRFGNQSHPSGGQRFGSQEYAAVNAVAGQLHATEVGSDVLAASSYPRVNGSLTASESGADALAAAGISSLLFTMQAREAATPDAFVSTGRVTNPSLRFGSQAHPGGGLRFGAQSWAALGPSGSLVVAESGSDGFAAAGFPLTADYTFAAFDVLAPFVNYSSESVGAGIAGTLDTGYKVLLPIATPGGVAFTWETNEAGNPSLRLANLIGARIIYDVPWYVWDGTSWAFATFDVSDAMQGAVFMVEAGADIFAANAAQTRYGLAALTETGEDFLFAVGAVSVRGGLSVAEVGSDSFAAAGAPRYIGEMFATELAVDSLVVTGGVIVTSSVALIEGATPDAFAATGALSSAGTLAAAEAGTDAFASFGFLTNRGTLAATEQAAPDIAAAAGVVRVAGALHAAESGADTWAANGRLDRIGAVALGETGSDVVAINGAIAVSGVLASTDRPDTFMATGRRVSTGDVVAAELAATEGGADRFVSRGRLGDVISLPTFDGQVKTLSSTRVVAIRSRRTAEAA